MSLMKLLSLLILVGAASTGQAATRIYTAPVANGGGPGVVLVTSWNVMLDPGEVITSATFASTFGNSSAPSSAIGALSVGGVTVATCDGPGSSCWDGPITPISYSFAPSEFGALTGMVDFVYDQTDCCEIRLGASTLQLETSTLAVPEPSTWGLLIAGFGAVGLATRRRRRTPQMTIAG
jgi:hypothetical protein